MTTVNHWKERMSRSNRIGRGFALLRSPREFCQSLASAMLSFLATPTCGRSIPLQSRVPVRCSPEDHIVGAWIDRGLYVLPTWPGMDNAALIASMSGPSLGGFASISTLTPSLRSVALQTGPIEATRVRSRLCLSVASLPAPCATVRRLVA